MTFGEDRPDGTLLEQLDRAGAHLRHPKVQAYLDAAKVQRVASAKLWVMREEVDDLERDLRRAGWSVDVTPGPDGAELKLVRLARGTGPKGPAPMDEKL